MKVVDHGIMEMWDVPEITADGKAAYSLGGHGCGTKCAGKPCHVSSGATSQTLPAVQASPSANVQPSSSKLPSQSTDSLAPPAQEVTTRMHAAGICCPAEISLVTSVLSPLPGKRLVQILLVLYLT